MDDVWTEILELESLGLSHAGRQEYSAAESYFRQAIRWRQNLGTAPDRGLAITLSNLAAALQYQDKERDAEPYLREAIALPSLASEIVERRNRLGCILVSQRRLDEAEECFNEAVRVDENYADARLNRSLIWLMRGDFERGFAEYEWRLGRPAEASKEWDGTPLDGRTLLLKSEQGLGDAIQFLRFARFIPRGSGGTVILQCDEPVLELARTAAGIDQLVIRGQELPPFDVAIPLGSMPRLFKTTIATIPNEIPYLFADLARIEYWRGELGRSPGLKVGIVWQGRKRYAGDKIRSVRLSDFFVLARLPGITLCSLQKGDGSEQLGDVLGPAIHDFGRRTSSTFSDTAALMKALDLVISVDTAVAHVAGAIGVPIWTLIPFASDWRWLIDREDSPWYPTMRLFRQRRVGDWATVFANVVDELQRFAKNSKAFLCS